MKHRSDAGKRGRGAHGDANRRVGIDRRPRAGFVVPAWRATLGVERRRRVGGPRARGRTWQCDQQEGHAGQDAGAGREERLGAVAVSEQGRGDDPHAERAAGEQERDAGRRCDASAQERRDAGAERFPRDALERCCGHAARPLLDVAIQSTRSRRECTPVFRRIDCACVRTVCHDTPRCVAISL